MNNKSLTDSPTLVLELLQHHVQSQKDAIKTLEQKALHNFTVVNIVAGILAAFNLTTERADPLFQLRISETQIGITPMLLLSVILVLLCAIIALLSVRAVWVRRQRTFPMEPTRRNVADWSSTDPSNLPELLQKSYLQIYQRNAQIVREKGSLARWSHRLILVLIMLILFGSTSLSLMYWTT